MSGEVERALLDAVQLGPAGDVLVLGRGDGLVLGAQERVGDGWVYVVRATVDELEELLDEAHAAGATGVAYLVGEPPVLPLPDGAVAAALGRVAPEHEVGAAAEELARVLASGGRLALAAETQEAGQAFAAAFAAAGFGEVALAEVGGEHFVTARLP